MGTPFTDVSDLAYRAGVITGLRVATEFAEQWGAPLALVRDLCALALDDDRVSKLAGHLNMMEKTDGNQSEGQKPQSG